jgi:methyl-accepting chemotaxis protein
MALDASGSLGTLFVELTANTANLVKGMNEGKEAVKKGAEGIMSVLESAKGMVEGFIAAFAIEKIAEWSLGIMESIDHLKKFSQEVDINVTKLGALKFAADKADVGDAYAHRLAPRNAG